MTSLDDLSRRYGVAASYRDITGRLVQVPDETRQALLAALGAPEPDPAGGESRPVEDDDSITHMPDHVARACFVPPFLEHGRCWGIALQLYQLRSDRSLGIGDFRDLGDLSILAAEAGADFLGVNPLHALFLGAPGRCSPFSPSNRRFLNPLYIAVEDAPGFEPEDVADADRTTLRDQTLVDYDLVASVKLRALRSAFKRWRQGGAPQKADFERFQKERGAPLADHAAFETLSCHFAAQGLDAGWLAWPHRFQDRDSPEVRQLLGDQQDEVTFHLYLQWVADQQLRAAARRAADAGMRIGLYVDLAIGEAPDGSAGWSDRSLVLPDVRVGAPPDYFNTSGQDWGLAPLSPKALMERDYAPLRDMLEDVMRHAGALRMDHVMGLLRLYLIPADHQATDGAYIRYDISRALEVLAQASHDRRAVIIGEDLGTVPHGFRELMAAAEVQSYRVFYFEQQDGRLAPPSHYPERALSCLSTHDLIPLAGWWQGHDIDLRLEHGLNSEEEIAEQREERRRHLEQVRADLAAVGMASADRETGGTLDTRLAAALHGYLATAPSRLFAVRLEDLAGETEPVNLPSTSDTYPNWRRRFPVPLDRLMASDRARAIMAAVAAARPRP